MPCSDEGQVATCPYSYVLPMWGYDPVAWRTGTGACPHKSITPYLSANPENATGIVWIS